MRCSVPRWKSGGGADGRNPRKVFPQVCGMSRARLGGKPSESRSVLATARPKESRKRLTSSLAAPRARWHELAMTPCFLVPDEQTVPWLRVEA